jgi:hypothetical protein
MIHCSRCDNSTESFSFWGYKREKNVYICETCRKAKKALNLKNYRKNQADKIAQQRQNYRAENRERLCEQSKQRYYDNKEEKLNKRKKDSRDPNSAYYKWRDKNREYLRLKAKEYRNQEGFLDKRKAYLNSRKKYDIDFKLVTYLRSRVSSLLKKSVKTDKTIPLLGCSISELKKHLESSWLEGMSWDNYGFYGWHIDHIKPCNTFDFSSEEDQKICFHYSNLRALWAKDNLSRPKDGSDLTD